MTFEEPRAAKNTDREIWRETPDDYYSPSIHVTEHGEGIGIDVGGYVFVKPVREWHRLAKEEAAERGANEVRASEGVLG
jgi:hypothetical protein